MGKLRQEDGMSITYRINGQVESFKTTEEMLDVLKSTTVENEPLTIEPIKNGTDDYDHMQEILELTYFAIPCLKGLQAMAANIQHRGSFIEYDTSDLMQMGIKCTEVIDEILSIAEAAEHVYESDRKINREKAERERDERLKRQPNA